jgi:uncharacterized protein YuzE
MHFHYDQEADMLYIELASKVSVESEEVAPGIVLDFGEERQVVGIEIEDASKVIDLSKLEVTAFPLVSFVLKNRNPNLAVSDGR